MPLSSDPTDCEEPSSSQGNEYPEPAKFGEHSFPEMGAQSQCSVCLDGSTQRKHDITIVGSPVTENVSRPPSPSLPGCLGMISDDFDHAETEEGTLCRGVDPATPRGDGEAVNDMQATKQSLVSDSPCPEDCPASLDNSPKVEETQEGSPLPVCSPLSVGIAPLSHHQGDSETPIRPRRLDVDHTELDIETQLEPIITQLNTGSLLPEPSDTHLTVAFTPSKPSGACSAPVSSPSKPNVSLGAKCASTHLSPNPVKLSGSFAVSKYSKPAGFRRNSNSLNPSRNGLSKLAIVADWIRKSGGQGPCFLLVPFVSMFLTVLRPIRHLLPEAIRVRLRSQTPCPQAQSQILCHTSQDTQVDTTLAVTTMSGQLCFLTRYGPFSESLDDEVTFQTPEGREEDANACQGVDNLAFESDLLIEQGTFSISPTVSGPHLNNGAPKTFRSRLTPNESSDSSEGSFSSQESLTETVPLGQPWRALGRFFSSTITSCIILFLITAVSLTLAGVSVFVVGPTPYFDKSLNAFQIPNHISTQRQLAFEAARKDNFRDLRKRSLDYTIADTFKNWDSEDSGIFKSFLPEANSEIDGFPEDSSNLDMPIMRISNSLFSGKLPANDPTGSKRYRREVFGQTKTTHRRTRRSVHFYRSMKWRIQLVYLAEGEDKNIFTKERLETIHGIEMSIMKHPRFTDFCSRRPRSYEDSALAPYKYCMPLNSLMTYFYPSVVDGKIVYDGVGSNLADINGTLSHAMTEPTFYWFVDTDMNTNNRRSRFIRSEVWFGTPIGETPTTMSPEEISRTYKEFLITYIDLLDNASTDKVRVLYGGTQLFDYEVAETIAHDLRLSIPTGVAILVLLFILTSFSVWLTLWGFTSILLSFAWAYFVYHVAFGKAALGLLNLVSGFVIIGIGVDDVFVFVNTYLQADSYRDPVQRMAHTIKTAGIATFFTSFTTAGAFAANIASQIPAINDFGLFMCLIVSFCWFLVALVMPCALTLWQRLFHCEVTIMRCRRKNTNDPAAAMATLSRVLARHERQATATQQMPAEGSRNETSLGPSSDGDSQRSSADDDIPMLNIEEDVNTQHLLMEDDEPLILTNDDDCPSSSVSSTPPHTKQSSSITKMLQAALYRFVATPVIKGRWIVILVYLMIFITSLVLVLQIKPAARPPALYNEDTNLQQLLDLAYNFSGKDIICKSCSGFSTDGGSVPHGGSGPVTLPPVIPIPTTKRSTGGDHHPVTVPHHGGVVTHEVTPQHPDHGEPTRPPVNTNPPDVHPKPTTHQHNVEITTTPTLVIRQTCADVAPTCRFDSTCDDSNTGPICRCIFDCDDRAEWVCGSNGQTYRNVCHLKKDGCERSQTISVTYIGHCFNPHTTSSGGGSSGGGASNTVGPGGGDTSGGGDGGGSSSSPGSGYNPCSGGTCGKPAARPVLDSTALVYVVFGIDHLERRNESGEHVVQENNGKVIYDSDFEIMNETTLKALCKICKNLAARTNLVAAGGAQCFPSAMSAYVDILQMTYEECRDLPVPNLLSGIRSKSLIKKNGSKVVWFAMAFETTTFMGKSSFAAYKDYNDWEAAIQEEKDALSDTEKKGLKTVFQTSSYWKQIFMEIVGVSSAIYGVAFSLLVCVIAVVIFTAHIGILVIAFLTIGGVIMVVVSMFYLLGWEMGAVEAVSLSIIVGSSIDYCIHLIEGYLVAGDRVPNSTSKTAPQMCRWRTRHSVSTIGVSILSSALTTIIASVPLCFTTIQLFAKFGKIVALNTFVSILYTLTACTAFLSVAGPARYRWNLKWFCVSAFLLGCLIGAIVVMLYVLHTSSVSIPGPSGNPLFSN